jgi:transcriptional regulator with XRE-family HTH domain
MKKELDIRKTVGSWLRQIRGQRGWTQEQVAEKANIPGKYYSEIERGLRNITLLNLQKILVALDVTKEDALRLLVTEDLSEDEAAIIDLVARLLKKGTKKEKRQATDILKTLVD